MNEQNKTINDTSALRRPFNVLDEVAEEEDFLKRIPCMNSSFKGNYESGSVDSLAVRSS